MNAEKIRAGITLALKQVTDRGWQGDLCLIRPDEMAVQTVERQLASANYNCVVIGAGVRLPPRHLVPFEAVINAIHRGAPEAAIAFNTRPEDSADAAARWLPPAESRHWAVATLGRSHDPAIAAASAASPRSSG